MSFLLRVSSLAILVFAGFSGVASAGAEPAITVSPAITEWVLSPGSSETKIIRIINNSDMPLPLQVAAESITLEEDISQESRQKFDASLWFTIKNPQFILKPRQVHTTKILMHVPEGAEPGGHYATIYFQQLLPVTDDPQARVSGQVGALALITVKGDIKHQLEIGSIYSARRDDGSLDINIDVQNTGNVHVLPTGRFVMRDWRGNAIEELPFPKGLVFPETERTYTVNWQSPPFAGYFNIEAEMQYGPDQTSLYGAGSFWILPRSGILLSLCAAIGLLLLALRARKRWVRAVRVLLRG